MTAETGHFERGRCGNAAPTFVGGPPELCVLPAEHPGWHRSDQGGEWNDPRPERASHRAADAEQRCVLPAGHNGHHQDRNGIRRLR